MSKVTVNKVDKIVTTVEKVKSKEVHLVLSEAEAIILRTILWHVGGVTPERFAASKIGHILEDVGVGILSVKLRPGDVGKNRVFRSKEDAIYFNEVRLEVVLPDETKREWKF